MGRRVGPPRRRADRPPGRGSEPARGPRRGVGAGDDRRTRGVRPPGRRQRPKPRPAERNMGRRAQRRHREQRVEWRQRFRRGAAGAARAPDRRSWTSGRAMLSRRSASRSPWAPDGPRPDRSRTPVGPPRLRECRMSHRSARRPGARHPRTAELTGGIEPAEPMPTYNEPPGLSVGDGERDDEPPLPDEERRKANAATTAATTPLDAGPGGILHVRFNQDAATDRLVGAMEEVRTLIRSRPGATRVVLHVPRAAVATRCRWSCVSGSPTTPTCSARSAVAWARVWWTCASRDGRFHGEGLVQISRPVIQGAGIRPRSPDFGPPGTDRDI